MTNTNNEKQYPKGHFIGMGLAIGIPIGVPIGLGLGAAMERKYNKNPIELTEKEKTKKKKMSFIGILVGLAVFVAIVLVYFLAR